LLESERERSSALARLNSVLEDLRLIVVSLRHDLESTKREKQALIEKYEKKI
jgi:hypothetical protein